MSLTNRSSTFDLQPSRLHQAIQGILLASVLTVSVAANAESTNNTGSVKRSYHISGGSLSQALRQFVTNSGLLFSAEAKLTDGKTSAGLDGEYTVEEGFRKLLAGSGLTYTLTDNNSVAIKVADTGKDAALTLPEVKVTGKAVSDPNDPYNPSYNRSNASTATKTDTSIMETPVSIQVIPRALMEDQQAIQLKDALKNVSGVYTGNQSGEYGYDKFYIRGFANAGSTQIYRNGLLLPRANNDTFNIEQIEVLKGPAAILYGRVEPGGLINTVTKKPLDTPYYSLQQQFGSFDHYRTMADATGPITSDKSLLYRLNIAYQDTGTFVNSVGNERILVAPSLQWKPSDHDLLNFRLEYQNDDSRYYNGIPAIGRRPANIPISTFLGWGGNNEYQKQQRIVVGYDWSHSFNDNWNLTNRFNYTNLDYTFINTYYGKSLATDNRSFTRANYNYPLDKTDTYGTNLDLTGRFNTYGIAHKVLLGFDYYRFENHAVGYDGPATAGFIPTVDIYNPVQSNVPLLTSSQMNSYSRRSQYWYGLYFQDQVTFFDKLHLLFGGRQDWATQTNASASNPQAYASATDSVLSDGAFTPRVGAVYKIQPSLSIYGNYVESFGVNNGRGFGSIPLKPQTATQYEGGIKKEWLDRKIITTFAYYDLTKENLTTLDPAHPQFVLPVGEARSRGVEFDVSGRITDNLSLIGSYSYTDTKITKDNRGTQGNQLANVPKHGGSLWGKYDFTQGMLKGFNLGTGIYLVGQREGDNANSFELPGYARWDAATGYKWKVGKTELSVQLNVNNLLDKTYYDASPAGATNIYPGIPRTFLGSIKIAM